MSKLLALFSLFRQGQSVADPKLWKERQISATVLGGVLVALVNTLDAFGVHLDVDLDTANTVAAGVLGVWNVVLTYITSDKVGVPAKSDADPAPMP